MTITAIRLSDLRNGTILSPASGANRARYLGDETHINLFRVITQFYGNAMWGQWPRTTAPREMLAALEAASTERSINGYAALLETNGSYHAPDTRYLWRLLDDQDRPIGWAVGWPYASGNAQVITRRFAKGDVEPAFVDRIRLVTVMDDAPMATDRVFVYSGASLGKLMGIQPLQARLAVWGNGIDDYMAAVPLVTELQNRVDRTGTLLDRHSSPHLQGPDMTADTPEATPEGGRTLPAVRLNEDGMFLPTDGQEGEYKYLTWDPNATLAAYHTDRIIDLLHIVTAVPSQAFGLGNIANASGVSLERQMFAALSKVNRQRREVERAAETFGQFSFDWVEDPFASFTERVELEVKLVEAGIISPAVAATRLGIENAQSEPKAPAFTTTQMPVPADA